VVEKPHTIASGSVSGCCCPFFNLFSDWNNKCKVYQTTPRTSVANPFAAHPSRESQTPERNRVMLVLSRKTTESICIGDGIEVRVLEISGGRVRLGIIAPAEIPVHRSEIAARIGEFLDVADGHSALKLVVAGSVPATASSPVGDWRLRRRAR
jgi:carbon storage regulator